MQGLHQNFASGSLSVVKAPNELAEYVQNLGGSLRALEAVALVEQI